MPAKGIYIYGMVPNLYSDEMLKLLNNSGVYTIAYQNISAIVSDTEKTQLENLDRESLGHLLVHHQKTIENLMGNGFSLFIPMRLCSIVNSKQDVIQILTQGYDMIIDSLKKIEHLTEIDIVATWADFSGILKEIANKPEILAIKEEILKKDGTNLTSEQIKMGMLVQSKLKEKNTKVELNILDLLSAVSLEIKTHEVMNDEMVTNSAFLINVNQKEKFEQVIDEIDEQYAGLLNFKMVGPLPCYSFFTIESKELDPEQIEQAKILLTLKDEATESEIKKAYLDKARLFHPDALQANSDQENFNRINKAYHTLIEYSAAVKQSSKENLISLAKEKVINNLILVKIKE